MRPLSDSGLGVWVSSEVFSSPLFSGGVIGFVWRCSDEISSARILGASHPQRFLVRCKCNANANADGADGSLDCCVKGIMRCIHTAEGKCTPKEVSKTANVSRPSLIQVPSQHQQSVQPRELAGQIGLAVSL